MATKHSKGGRPPPKFYTENFRQLEAVGNNSNRFFWACLHCSADSESSGLGSHIEGRDNRLYKHIAEPRLCPAAPTKARQEARQIMAGKGHVYLDVPVISSSANPDLDVTTGTSANNLVSEPAITAQTVAAKKRKGGTLDYFVDHALSEKQIDEAHVKLFR